MSLLFLLSGLCFPSFTHENSFLTLPSLLCPGFRVFAKTVSPTAPPLHKTHQLFPATEPGREPRILFADVCRQAGWGVEEGRGEAHT